MAHTGRVPGAQGAAGERTKFKYDLVDWEKTKAWGDGGYYGRCFLNVAGREPQGTIPAGDYEKVRAELKEKLEAITDEQGVNIGTRAFRPEELYRAVGNVAPDLIVYFGDLDWRSIGSVGNAAIRVHENDNPGAVSKVTAIIEDDTEVELWEGQDPSTNAPAVFVVEVAEEVRARRIKVYLDTTRRDDWNETDAVEITAFAAGAGPPENNIATLRMFASACGGLDRVVLIDHSRMCVGVCRLALSGQLSVRGTSP